MYKSPEFIKRYLIKDFIYVIKVCIWSKNLCYLKIKTLNLEKINVCQLKQVYIIIIL